MNHTSSQIGVETAVAIISKFYNLEVSEVATMLECIGSITPEQRETAIIIGNAFKAQEMINNQIKGVKS